MKRRELVRRGFWGLLSWLLVGPAQGVSAAALREFPPGYDASLDLKRSDWKPTYLSDHQNETLIVLSDLILPATDTPGAKDALANRFIDRLLSASAAEDQLGFIRALSFVDGESLRLFGSALLHVSVQRQRELLVLLSQPHSEAEAAAWREHAGHAHFLRLKGWISRAYYSSEPGMSELGWDGGVFHQEFEGCSHTDGAHR